MAVRPLRSLRSPSLEILVRAGSVVVRQGEPLPPMRAVVDGAFVVEVLGHDGRRLLLDVLGPGDGLGGPGDGLETGGGSRLSQVTVRALRPGRLRELEPGEAVPLLVRRAERAARLAADLAWFDVPTRLLARLHMLGARFGRPVPGGVSIALRLTHEDLAGLCGTSRESVTRAMGRLIRDGRVEVPRRSRIVLHHGLSALPSWSTMSVHDPQ
jgi:CRP-like cAMP-binding protein